MIIILIQSLLNLQKHLLLCFMISILEKKLAMLQEDI